MNKIKTFYKISEKVFFISMFSLFFMGLLMRNDFFVERIKIIIFTIDLPIIFFAIAYGALSIRFSITDEKNEILDSILLFIGGATFIFFLFVHLAYPNII